MLTCRLISDIHLELYPNTQIKIEPADILVLAGDIGNPFEESYTKLLSVMSEKFNKIFLITGNHEYYNGHSMAETEDQIRSVVKQFPKVSFLQKDIEIYQGYRFMGCTLWSKSKSDLCKYYNDFRYISGMTSEVYNQLHDDHAQWLTDNIESDYETIVITHHLPHQKLVHRKYADDPMNIFYVSDQSQCLTYARVWCCGHTHHAKQCKINSCYCFLNPHGYEGEISGYNYKLLIDLSVLSL